MRSTILVEGGAFMSQKRKGTRILLEFIIFLFAFFFLVLVEKQIHSSAASSISVPAKVIGENVYVRKEAGRLGEKLRYEEKEVKLSKNRLVIIKGQAIVNGEKWYRISFEISDKTFTGYMLSDYVQLTLENSVRAKMIAADVQKVRTKAGKEKYLKVSKKVVTLKKGKAVKILKEVTVDKKKWFYVSFSYNKKTYKGYILADSIAFTATSVSTESPSPSPSPSQKTETEMGVVTANRLNVRLGAGTNYGNLLWNASKVQLIKGTDVAILGSKDVNGVLWYQISFQYSGKEFMGYVCANYIAIGETKESTKPTESAEPSETVSQAPVVSEVPSSDFEASLDKEGFPESYKNSLRILHEKYPLWQFKAFQVNYDWDTVIEKETALGKNLITNSKALGWKSFETGAYNWSTDKFVPFDGSTWVTASKAAVEYYMDPRNFLTTDGIFQFEYLAYEPQYQTIDGVESILNNTILGDTKYTYTDASGMKQTITYGETFLSAAEYSNVNPFHLATRVKQEVVTSKGLSSSATGSFSGYFGYYNFYNIGATHSTAVNGAIMNGLKFAKTGNGMSAANKTTFMIPWNNPYNAIVGGAKYIGNNYINRGQNTVYLQKFNLSSYSTFKHQYMANVEAAKAEAQKTYAAYRNFVEIPVVFYIPIFRNMPAKNCPVPETVKNPNNWLKTLSVTDQTMTPTFKIGNDEDTSYTVMVDSDTASVKINAASVSSFAHIDGTGTYTISEGTNRFKVTVTAQNGEKRSYTLYVIKE